MASSHPQLRVVVQVPNKSIHVQVCVPIYKYGICLISMAARNFMFINDFSSGFT